MGVDEQCEEALVLQQDRPLHLILFPCRPLDLLLDLELAAALHHRGPLLVAVDVVGFSSGEFADAAEVVGGPERHGDASPAPHLNRIALGLMHASDFVGGQGHAPGGRPSSRRT